MGRATDLVVALLVVLSPMTAFAASITFDQLITNSSGQIEYCQYCPDPLLKTEGMTFLSAPLAENIHVNSAEWANQRTGLPYTAANNGTNYLTSFSESHYNDAPATSMDFLSTDLFMLTSVDLAEAGWDGAYPYSPVNAVTFIGYRADGSTATTTFTLDWVLDGPGEQADFQTFTFGAEWTSLQRVSAVPIPTYPYEFGGTMPIIFQLDNVNFTSLGTRNTSYTPFIAHYATPPTNPPQPLRKVSEPSTLLLLGTGLAGFVISRRRFSKRV